MKKFITLTMLLTCLSLSAQTLDHQSLRKIVLNIRAAQKENLRGNAERVNQNLTQALMTLSQFMKVSTEITQIKVSISKSMASKSDCNTGLIESANSEQPEYSSGNVGYWKRELENKINQKCMKDEANCDFDTIQFQANFKSTSSGMSVVSNIGSCEIVATVNEEI